MLRELNIEDLLNLLDLVEARKIAVFLDALFPQLVPDKCYLLPNSDFDELLDPPPVTQAELTQ